MFSSGVAGLCSENDGCSALEVSIFAHAPELKDGLNHVNINEGGSRFTYNIARTPVMR
jgi:hypothetical protein